MGRYGIDWDKGLQNFTEEDYNLIMTETTKIIDEKNTDMNTLSGAFYDRGVLFEIKNEYRKAISDYTSSIKIRDNFYAAYYNRGRLFALERKYDIALSDLNKAMQINPDNQDTIKLIGHVQKAKQIKEDTEKEANNG